MHINLNKTKKEIFYVENPGTLIAAILRLRSFSLLFLLLALAIFLVFR